MFSSFAILVYLVALGLPIYFLFHFHSQAWYWHVLSALAALCLGLVPMPAWAQAAYFDLLMGFLFVFLIVWGVGGLILFRPHHPHHEKHA